MSISISELTFVWDGTLVVTAKMGILAAIADSGVRRLCLVALGGASAGRRLSHGTPAVMLPGVS